MAIPSELVGSFVVEVGLRQAWTFLTFCDNRPTPSVERRLYIENGIEVVPTRAIAPGDALATQVLAMTVLNGLTVTSAAVEPDGALLIHFTEDAFLRVEGEPAFDAAMEPWWFGSG